MWKELLPASLSSGGHTRLGIQPWALACSRGQQRKVAEKGLVMVETRATQFCLRWQRGLSGSLSGRQDNLSGRSQRKSSTCLKQSLGEFVLPQPKRTITKSPVYVPEFMGTWASFVSKLLLPHLSRDAATLLNWEAHAFFPSKIAATMATFISKCISEYLLLFA